MAPPTPSRMAWLRAAPSASPDPQACRAAIRCVESSARLSISPNLQIGQQKPSEAHSRVQSLIDAHRGPLREFKVSEVAHRGPLCEFKVSEVPTEGPFASSKSPRYPPRAISATTLSKTGPRWPPARVQTLQPALSGPQFQRYCCGRALAGPSGDFVDAWGPAGHFLRTFTVGVNRSAQLELALADKPHSVRKSAIK